MSRIALNIIALSASESQQGNYVLVLEEVKGFRRLPIIIGPFEAQAIAIALEKMNPVRPLTHDLMCKVLEAGRLELKEVDIHQLVGNTFHARLVCREKRDGQTLHIDARASDAVALAVRTGCPIFTNEQVMEAAAIVLDNPSKAFTQKRGKLEDYSLEELERLLQRVLEKEDYESAARIRNAIRRKKGEL